MIDSKRWTHLLHNVHGDDSWELIQTQPRGRAVRALRTIRANELLFEEDALLIGPIGSEVRAGDFCVSCQRQCVPRRTCSRGCGLPVCDVECPRYKSHIAECEIIRSWQPKYDGVEVNRKVIAILATLRAMLLDVDKRWMLDEMQANRAEALEQSVVVEGPQPAQKGLYALAGQLNHDCVPNTRYSFDKDSFRIRIYASKDIPPGEEITTSYTSLLWDTATRRIHLHRTKQFWCACARCSDRTEFGTYLAALRCRGTNSCAGRVLPDNPLNPLSDWECDECSTTLSFGKVRQTQLIVNGILQTLVKNASEDSLDLWACPSEHRILRTLVWASNKTVIESKMQALWKHTIGESVLVLVEQFCVDVLQLVDQLGAGECTLKALVSEELVKIEKLIKNK